MRYHIQGTLEVLAEMLDRYNVTEDAGFAKEKIAPFGDAIVTYYAQHWPRDPNGKIRMTPAQSLETSTGRRESNARHRGAQTRPAATSWLSIVPRKLKTPRPVPSPRYIAAPSQSALPKKVR
jgi:hypothetical protein